MILYGNDLKFLSTRLLRQFPHHRKIQSRLGLLLTSDMHLKTKSNFSKQNKKIVKQLLAFLCTLSSCMVNITYA